MRGSLVIAVIAGCGPSHVTPAALPTFPDPPPSYDSRIVTLRTALGRAGIRLDMRGLEVRTSSCDDPGNARTADVCAVCELAAESDHLDGTTLEAITRAFDRYPTSVLSAANIQHVSLCNRIEYQQNTDQVGATAKLHGIEEAANLDRRPAGTADPSGHRLLISVEYFTEGYDPTSAFTVDDVVHHEVFHMLDAELMRDTWPDDPEWRLQNPIGFQYAKPVKETTRPHGFVNVYATTNDIEDRASVFEILMSHPDNLCSLASNDVILRTKIQIVWTRVAAVEGDAFLRKQASCVDWIAEIQAPHVLPAPGPLEAEGFLAAHKLTTGHVPAADTHWLRPPDPLAQ
ncbi:MAG: hypothetical protein JWO36_4191 [Myxococcales bacterium]|nr:hypothetical protein [Myxococcales bacterium]